MFTKAKQNLLVDSVVEQIEAAIINRKLLPGDRLPGTEALQESFGASRGTLREAFRVLRQKGLLRTKSGAGGGVFIQSMTTDPVKEELGLLIRAGRIELEALTEFREGLEGCVAELAARGDKTCNYKILDGLKDRLNALAQEGPGKWEEFHSVEAALHRGLVRLIGNPLFELNIDTVHENIGCYYRRYLPKTREVLERNCRDWDRLLKALKAAQREEAGRIMREHIRWSNEEMISSRGVISNRSGRS